MKKHSVTNPNVFVIFNVICSSSGGATSLVSLSKPTTCKPVDSCPMASLPTGTAQYWGLIFNSLGERGSINGWHILSSKVLRLRKNPSSAWDVARNSNIWATICDKIRQKLNRDLQWRPKILGTDDGYLPLTVKMHKNPQRCKIIHDIMSHRTQRSIMINQSEHVYLVQISCLCSFCGSYYSWVFWCNGMWPRF